MRPGSAGVPRATTMAARMPALLRYRDLTASPPGEFVSLCAREVCAFGRIDFDFFAFVNEGRHLHDKAGFGLGRLGDARRGGALQAGFDFRHGQNYGLGQLDADGFAIEELDLDLEIGREVLDGVS